MEIHQMSNSNRLFITFGCLSTLLTWA